VQWFEDHKSAITMQHEAFQRLQAAIFAGDNQGRTGAREPCERKG